MKSFRTATVGTWCFSACTAACRRDRRHAAIGHLPQVWFWDRSAYTYTVPMRQALLVIRRKAWEGPDARATVGARRVLRRRHGTHVGLPHRPQHLLTPPPRVLLAHSHKRRIHNHVGDRLHSHQTMQPLSPPLAQATRRLRHSLLLMPLFSIQATLVLARLVAHGAEGEGVRTCFVGTWLCTGCSRPRANESLGHCTTPTH